MVDWVISLLIRLASGGDGVVVVAVFITVMFWGYAVGRTCK